MLKMKKFTTLFQLSVFCFTILFAGLVTNSQDVVTFEKEFGFTKKDGTKEEKLEPSAVEAINDKYLLVADDKFSDLLIVETATGKINDNRVSTSKFADPKPKWEAMAFDGEFFYIAGSHNVKIEGDLTKLPGKLAARSHLFRFKLGKVSGDMSEVVIDEWLELDIEDSLKTLGLYSADPKINKVKIEGLAIRTNKEKKAELFFALREPHDLMWVYSAEIPTAPISKEKLQLKQYFSFDAGNIGTIPFRLSSLEYVPQLAGFLAITSTEDEKNLFYGNGLWLIRDATSKVAVLSKPLTAQLIASFDVKMKAEGLTVLPESTSAKLRIALVYDNDADDTKVPGMMRLLELSSKSK